MAATMKKQRLQRDRRLFKRKLSTSLLGLLVVATLLTFTVVIWQKSTQPVNTSDYDGTIVVRWADYTQSEQVSRPYFHLLVESNDDNGFFVKVDPNIYESARVGMVLKSVDGQFVLIDS